jgi:hypothetical protein
MAATAWLMFLNCPLSRESFCDFMLYISGASKSEKLQQQEENYLPIINRKQSIHRFASQAHT